MTDRPLDLPARRSAVLKRVLRLMFRPPATDDDIELVNQALDRCIEQINEEKLTMRLADWWDGLDELDDAGNRRDDSLWEPPVVDYEITSETGIRAAQMFDGGEDEPCWDDEVSR